LSAGPAIGGLVLDALDWRWVFWINVPVGLAGTVLGWLVLPPSRACPTTAASKELTLRVSIHSFGDRQSGRRWVPEIMMNACG
jgi:MFS family permease